MQRTAFTAAALLASFALPSLAADAPAAPAAPAVPAPAAPAAPAPAAAAPATPAPAADIKESTLPDSLIKLTITTQAPDITHPWAPTGKPVSTIGAGVCLKAGDKSYVLVTGGAVSYATKIEGADGTVFSVAFASPFAQLALLSPKTGGDDFFKNHPGLDLTESAGDILFAGFGAQEKDPVGIAGLVSAIRVDGNALTGIASLKNLVKDTAYGPAIAGNKDSGFKIAGLFSGAQVSQDQKSAAATFVPASEIKVFLDDVKDGRCDGKWTFKNLKANYKPLINPALRAKLGLKAETQGLLVTGEAAAIAPFQSGDILTKIGSVALDNEGAAMIGTGAKAFKGGVGSAFYHINAQAKADAKTLTVTVLRAGKETALEIPVSRRGDELLPSLVEKGAQPRYFVFGPLCFEQATSELAQALVQRRGADLVLSGHPIGAHLNDNVRSTPDQEIVVLSNLLPHDITKGYSGGGFPAVKSVNGKDVVSLRQLAQLLNDCKDEYVEIAFHGKDADSMVFKRTEMLEASEQINIDNGIVKKCSKDLADIVK